MILSQRNKWCNKLKNFTIVSNIIKDEELKRAKKIKDIILSKGQDYIVSICEMEECINFDFTDTDCIIVLGGDGTMLRVAKDTVNYCIPVIGVNLGNLGFLTEVEIDSVSEAIDRLISGDYTIEERMMLEGVALCEQSDGKSTVALNDIVLSRRMDMMLVGYRVVVNGKFLKDFYADGIIISSPTGSTGYNMSAGGSIVEPSARLMVLTAVCPHTLDTRSIILSPDDKVEIEVLPPKGDKDPSVGAYFDGRSIAVLSPGDKVMVKKSKVTTRICKLSNTGFLEVLNKKMNG